MATRRTLLGFDRPEVQDAAQTILRHGRSPPLRLRARGKRWLAPGTISSALGPRSRANACSLSSTTPKSAPPTIRIVGACKGFVLDELHWFCGSDPPVSGVSSTLTPKGPLVTWLRRAAAEGGRSEWRNQNPSGSHYYQCARPKSDQFRASSIGN